MEDQKCRVCGCTENNCEQCIRQTGVPCHWVEEDLCSACHESITEYKNKQNMNFFQQLAEAGNVDMTIRIMQKNDKLTLNIMPGSSNSTTKPMIISGTGAELDEAFFSTIKPAVDEVAGIITNIEEVKADAKKKEEAQKKPKSTPAPAAKKSEVKKPESTKKESPKPISQNLFEEAGGNDNEEVVQDDPEEENHDDDNDNDDNE